MNKLALFLIIVSVCIVGVITFYILKPFQGYFDRNDAQRKHDLAKIAASLEEYKLNYGSYPDYNSSNYTIQIDETEFIWGHPWMPYIEMLPRDPVFIKRYVYWVDRNGGYKSYRLYASLDNPDPICGTKDCPHAPGEKLCGTNSVCNYGVTSGNISP